VCSRDEREKKKPSPLSEKGKRRNPRREKGKKKNCLLRAGGKEERNPHHFSGKKNGSNAKERKRRKSGP